MTFDLERFEWTAGDRLEVAGRWFGIRGRRFLRPTLDIEVDGQPRRMLAVLEHKPWAAEEGSEWMAAFTWRHEPIDPAEAELAVAQDLTVQLPAPSTAPGASRKRERGRRQDRRSGQRAAGPPRAELLERERAARVEAQRLRVELEQARATHAEAARELRERVAAEEAAKQELAEQLQRARKEAAAAAKTADGLRAEVEEAVAARDSAVAAAGEAARERDARAETARWSIAAAKRPRPLATGLARTATPGSPARGLPLPTGRPWRASVTPRWRRARAGGGTRPRAARARHRPARTRQRARERDTAVEARDATREQRDRAFKERDAAVRDRDSAAAEHEAADATATAHAALRTATTPPRRYASATPPPASARPRCGVATPSPASRSRFRARAPPRRGNPPLHLGARGPPTPGPLAWRRCWRS